MKSIAIFVLAAGTSSRMKTIKQLLKIKDKTLLEIVLENAKEVNKNNVFCILGANAEKIKSETSTKNINYVFNENFKNGLSSSIVSGVKYIEKKHPDLKSVLILLADQPNIDSAYLQELISQFQKNKTKIIASNYEGKLGVPAIFAENYFETLKSLKGDKGAKYFLNSNLENIISINTNKLVDLDTVQEYKDFIK